MAPQWELRLHDPAGLLVAIFDQWDEFTCTREVNAPAVYGFHLADDDRYPLFEYDGQIEAWRSDAVAGIAWYTEFEGFHVDEDLYFDAEGKLHFVSSGRGYQDLLLRTIVQDKADTAGSHKTGVAESVMKDFVDEQAGPSAGARARSGLTIQADGAAGNAIDIARAYRNVLDACQDISAIGGGDFDVVGTGAAAFQFRWYTGQRGTDRTATVVFAQEYQNMAEPRLQVRRSRIVNAALVAGQGEGSGRETLWRTDPASIALSPWGRKEALCDAREVEIGNTGALEDKGDGVLAENDKTVTFTFTALQTPGLLYGRDYFLGDLVTARFLGVSYTKKIQRVTLTVNREGETVDVGMIDA